MGHEETIPLALMRAGEGGVLAEVRGLRRQPASECRPAGPRNPRRSRRGRHLSTSDRGHRLEHRLRCLGFVPGAEVRVIRNDAAGPLIAAVDGSRVCLGRGVAFRLMVAQEAQTRG